MLIPLRHENMGGRRWPVATFALIALNVLIFLGTHWKIEAQQPERYEVRIHLILLSAMHPELKMPDDVQQYVNEVQRNAPEAAWKQLSSPSRKAQDAWDAQIRLVEDPDFLQNQMDSLSQRFADEEKSPLWRTTHSCPPIQSLFPT